MLGSMEAKKCKKLSRSEGSRLDPGDSCDRGVLPHISQPRLKREIVQCPVKVDVSVVPKESHCVSSINVVVQAMEFDGWLVTVLDQYVCCGGELRPSDEHVRIHGESLVRIPVRKPGKDRTLEDYCGNVVRAEGAEERGQISDQDLLSGCQGEICNLKVSNGLVVNHALTDRLHVPAQPLQHAMSDRRPGDELPVKVRAQDLPEPGPYIRWQVRLGRQQDDLALSGVRTLDCRLPYFAAPSHARNYLPGRIDGFPQNKGCAA